MKRKGYLWGDICRFDALYDAAREAMRGKRSKQAVARFFVDLEPELWQLLDDLNGRSYRPQPYRVFTVTDPKPRRICAPDIRDRVLHHAICRVVEPVLEGGFIHDTYACRRGKGTHAAIRRAQCFMRRSGYYLQLDVARFFDSVDNTVIKQILRRKLKDPDLLWLLDTIIDHRVPFLEHGKGMPIGNLTSQIFANLYLDPLDHLVKDELGVKRYVRYMDDLLLFSRDKGRLWDLHARVESFLADELSLRFKDRSTTLAPVSEGMTFLGFRVFPSVIRLTRRGWRRFRRKVIEREQGYADGACSEEELVRSAASLVGHLAHADARNLSASFFRGRPGLL